MVEVAIEDGRDEALCMRVPSIFGFPWLIRCIRQRLLLPLLQTWRKAGLLCLELPKQHKPLRFSSIHNEAANPKGIRGLGPFLEDRLIAAGFRPQGDHDVDVSGKHDLVLRGRILGNDLILGDILVVFLRYLANTEPRSLDGVFRFA